MAEYILRRFASSGLSYGSYLICPNESVLDFLILSLITSASSIRLMQDLRFLSLLDIFLSALYKLITLSQEYRELLWEYL